MRIATMIARIRTRSSQLLRTSFLLAEELYEATNPGRRSVAPWHHTTFRCHRRRSILTARSSQCTKAG